MLLELRVAYSALRITLKNCDRQVVPPAFLTYFIVQGVGDLSLSRRGDLRVSNDGFLENGTSQSILNTNLQPIKVPDYRFMTVSDDGNVVIEPLGSDPGTRQNIGRIALTTVSGGELKKYADGEIRLRDGVRAIPHVFLLTCAGYRRVGVEAGCPPPSRFDVKY